MTQECEERQAEEIEALKGVYGLEDGDGIAWTKEEVLVVTLRLVEDEEDSDVVGITFHVPSLYPLKLGAEVLNVNAPSKAAEAMAAGNEVLSEGAASEEVPGVESLWSACEAVLEVVRAGLEELARERWDLEARERERAKRAEEARGFGAGDEPHNCVIYVDHMNESGKYMKLLRKWSLDLGLGTRLFYRSGGKKRPKGVENIFICLSGTPGAISMFGNRLRTEYVDVDYQGNKCKERMSKVLANRRPGDVKEGEGKVPFFAGFEALEYKTEEEMEEMLQTLNLLHCGDGSERFFASEQSH
ncbi:hypothetical protein HOP50_01g08650 [Chloropicon primus]|uniref:RWD domain-containing protein n=1 Tax=Chloropicon primus TaxID=1764295 RepID=A0A5B8MD25_9CHLO|nr:hypothetical protein A3770_01p08770 [Chloropicon primus]UPQ97570.1 hypothetical protein HOP50_01g08650 [Chloropicon primus]|eukprot:QDZ18359.1 hypothetical protein A3770_01p08770 [Chloropicon primus]